MPRCLPKNESCLFQGLPYDVLDGRLKEIVSVTVEMQSVGVKGTRIDLFATIEAAVDIEESDRRILSRGAV